MSSVIVLAMPDAALFAENALPAPVLVVEDESLLQQRLCAVLRELGYAPDALLCAASLEQARSILAAQPVALALIDLQLPDGDGTELIGQLRAEDPGLGILVVSAWNSQDAILRSLRAGATGYVLKERDDFEVMLSIRSVLRGGAPIDPFIARRILQLLPQSGAAAVEAQTPAAASVKAASLAQEVALSKRETQILQQVCDGLSNREIAEKLFLSTYTVETHIKRIYRKLAVSSRTMAVRAARAQGLSE